MCMWVVQGLIKLFDVCHGLTLGLSKGSLRWLSGYHFPSSCKGFLNVTKIEGGP